MASITCNFTCAAFDELKSVEFKGNSFDLTRVSIADPEAKSQQAHEGIYSGTGQVVITDSQGNSVEKTLRVAGDVEVGDLTGDFSGMRLYNFRPSKISMVGADGQEHPMYERGNINLDNRYVGSFSANVSYEDDALKLKIGDTSGFYEGRSAAETIEHGASYFSHMLKGLLQPQAVELLGKDFTPTPEAKPAVP